ncbi:copper ion binding protein [Desulfolucanica intricata]|uniref:copper ion binding protein n=1 Tax=Desulfolucanica intricata TaxID=1285191 RepID=UPI0008321A9A|nr:copper ion binding protein [Desulfolucanica intricata]
MECCSNSKQTITLNVEGMSCNHCKMAVENALRELNVDNVEVDLAEKKVLVTFNKSNIKIEDIKKAVTKAGYEVVE